MLDKNLPLQKKIEHIVFLYEKNYLEKAIVEIESLAKENPNVPILHNIYGCITNNLGKWNKSVRCFSKAIELNPKYADAYYNLGIAFDSLEKLREAVNSYSKAIELKPDNPKFYEGLIRLLNFYNPKKLNSNSCVKANMLIQKVKYNYHSDKKIPDDEVTKFYQKCYGIISKNTKNINVNETEIFRSNLVDLKCDRHFLVFITCYLL